MNNLGINAATNGNPIETGAGGRLQAVNRGLGLPANAGEPGAALRNMYANTFNDLLRARGFAGGFQMRNLGLPIQGIAPGQDILQQTFTRWSPQG